MRPARLRWVPLVLAWVLTMPARTPSAFASAESVRCGIARQKASVQLSRDLAACYPESTCYDAATARFTRRMERLAQLPGCLSRWTEFQILDDAVRFPSELGILFAPGATPPTDPCVQDKLAATIRDYRRAMQCHWRALPAAGTPAPGCFAKAMALLTRAFGNAEGHHTCPAGGTVTAAATKVGDQITQVLREIPTRACAEVGDAPTCGGPCPPGNLCLPSGAGCACAPSPCLTDTFACTSACPGGGTCAGYLDANFQPACRCVFPTQPCGDTAPVCNGTCPSGTTCGRTETSTFGDTCGCVPDGTTACSDAGGFPVCGGSCPAEGGSVCAYIDFQVGQFLHSTGCNCGGNAPCAEGGVVCPAGQYCFGALAPGFSMRYCRSPSGAFTD